MAVFDYIEQGELATARTAELGREMESTEAIIERYGATAQQAPAAWAQAVEEGMTKVKAHQEAQAETGV